MILNKDNILYYGNNGPEPRLQSSLFCIRDFDDADYWYVDFFHGRHLADVCKNIPTDVLSEIRAGNVTLLLNNSHESFHDVVEYIYLYLVDGLNIPAYNITLLSESAIIDEEVKVIANKYRLPEIKTEWIRIFEYSVHTVTTKTINTLTHKPYIKKFLNLNRTWRTHRPIFVALLKIHGLLEQGHVSLAPAGDNRDWGRMWENIIYHEPDLIQYKDEFMEMPALYLDTLDMHINQVALTDSTDQYYTDTYFSVYRRQTSTTNMVQVCFSVRRFLSPSVKDIPF